MNALLEIFTHLVRCFLEMRSAMMNGCHITTRAPMHERRKCSNENHERMYACHFEVQKESPPTSLRPVSFTRLKRQTQVLATYPANVRVRDDTYRMPHEQ